jgi:hypothetical protein
VRAMQASDFETSKLDTPWFARLGMSDQLVLATAELQTGQSVAAAHHLQEIGQQLDRLLAAGEEMYGIYSLKAEVLALSGDAEGAMQALNRAADLGWRDDWLAQREPSFAALWPRSDFRALMLRVDAADRRMRSQLKPDQ